jgi:hypothetical protein
MELYDSRFRALLAEQVTLAERFELKGIPGLIQSREFIVDSIRHDRDSR